MGNTIDDDWRPPEGMRYVAPDSITPRQFIDRACADVALLGNSASQVTEALQGPIAAFDELGKWAKRLRAEHPECPKDAPILDWLVANGR